MLNIELVKNPHQLLALMLHLLFLSDLAKQQRIQTFIEPLLPNIFSQTGSKATQFKLPLSSKSSIAQLYL